MRKSFGLLLGALLIASLSYNYVQRSFIAEQTGQLRTKDVEIGKLNAALKKARAKNDNELRVDQDRVQTLRVEYDEKKARLDSAEIALRERLNRGTDASYREHLVSQLKDHQQTLQSLQAELSRLQKQESTVNAGERTAQGQSKLLERDNEAKLTASIQASQTHLTELKTQLSDLMKRRFDANAINEIPTVRSEIDLEQKNLKGLRAQRQTISQTGTVERVEIHQSEQSAIQSVRSSEQSVRKQIEAETSQIKATNQQLAGEKHSEAQSTQEIAQSRQEIASLRARLGELEAEIKKLESEIAELKE